jgi:hypothetical protein
MKTDVPSPWALSLSDSGFAKNGCKGTKKLGVGSQKSGVFFKKDRKKPTSRVGFAIQSLFRYQPKALTSASTPTKSTLPF